MKAETLLPTLDFGLDFSDTCILMSGYQPRCSCTAPLSSNRDFNPFLCPQAFIAAPLPAHQCGHRRESDEAQPEVPQPAPLYWGEAGHKPGQPGLVPQSLPLHSCSPATAPCRPSPAHKTCPGQSSPPLAQPGMTDSPE